MQTKLTLRIDAALVKRAKSHGRRVGKSVSRIVADYFRMLDAPGEPPAAEPPAPVVESLRGLLAGGRIDEADYRRHLEKKHGVRVLFDTDVVLDVLVDRAPFAAAATRLMAQVEHGGLAGYLGATTVATVHYLVARSLGSPAATEAITTLLGLFDVAPVNRHVLGDALVLGLDDYEDAVLHEAARHAGVPAIVTRDRTGFRAGTLAIYSPEELLRTIDSA